MGALVSTEQISETKTDVRPSTAEPLPGLEMLDRAATELAGELSRDAARLATPATVPNRAAANRAGLKRLSVLIPVYNERWTVEDVIRQVAAVPLPIEREIVVIDDGSSDGSAELVQSLESEIAGLRLIRQSSNGGKGTAIRRGIEVMTGDVAVIQDADLEYDPSDLPALLQPLLDDQADAVFGSRFAGSVRRCLPFWHSQINRALTVASNAVTGVSLTDMETGYKLVRADILSELRLRSRSFTFEPELVCRLSQWGARMVEMPIQYHARSFEEGKKIRPRDGIKALLTLLRCRFVDSQYSHYTEDANLRSLRRASNYNSWLADEVEHFLGNRVLDAGAGVGTLSGHLLRRERVVMVDHDEHRTRRLEARFGRRSNVRVEQGALEDRELINRLEGEQLDTILCANTLQQIGPDFLVLRNFHKMLQAGGRCVLVVPIGPALMNRMDRAARHQRRYESWQLAQLMERAGFEVVQQRSFNRLGGLGWWVNGSVVGSQRVGSVQTTLFDKLWPVAKHVDRWLPGPALSALIVGEKR